MRNKVGRDEKLIAVDNFAAEREYWREKISGFPTTCRIPYDHNEAIEPVIYKSKEFVFKESLFDRIMEKSKHSDYKIHVILAAILAVLLGKYTGSKDTLFYSPIYKPGIEGKFINTLLPLRIGLDDKMTFKDLLKQVGGIILEATENQNFPIEVLFDQLNFPLTANGGLSEVALVLENIHHRDHLLSISPPMIWTFMRTEDSLQGLVEYAANFYEAGTVQGVIEHFRLLMNQAISDLDLKLPQLIIPEIEEKRQYGIVNNGPGNNMPYDKKNSMTQSVAPPENEIEKKMAQIWSEILEISEEGIGIDDYFFKLNANSLNAIMLTSMIHKEFNVSVPLEKIFQLGTIRKLVQYINSAKKYRYVSIEPIEKKEYYPLSSAQKRLYILQQMDDQNTVYNVPLLHLLSYDLDKEKFKETMQRMIERHESLRTSFILRENESVQKINLPEEVPFEIEYYEVRKEEVQKIIENFVKPFNLSQLPLIRVGLLAVGKRDHFILLLDMHHIITDAFSRKIFVKEFMALYAGEKLPSLKLHYKDYAEWQNCEKQQKIIKQQGDYWQKQFKGDIPSLNLPIDYPRAKALDFSGGFFNLKLSNQLVSGIYDAASQADVTTNIFLLAALNLLISKYTGQHDIVVGSIILGRSHKDLENIIGFFINMIALRNQVVDQITFGEFLENVRLNSFNGYENQDYPFEELVNRLKIQRVPGKHPLVEVVLTYHDVDIIPGEGGIGKEEVIPAVDFKMDYKNAHFDLLLHATPGEKQLSLTFEYASAIFKGSTIEKMAGHFQEILEQVVENPEILLKDIIISHDFTQATVNILKTDNGEFVF